MPLREDTIRTKHNHSLRLLCQNKKADQVTHMCTPNHAMPCCFLNNRSATQPTPFPAHPIPRPGHQPRPPNRGPASSRPMTAGDVTRPRPNCRRIPLVPANSSTCSRPQNRTSRSLQEDAAAHSGTPCGQSTAPHVASKQQAADPREAVQVPQQPCGGCHRCHSSTGPTSWLCCQVWRRENCCNTRNTAAHKI